MNWLPEGSLAGSCWFHEMALELVCGADFSCKLMCGAGPGDLGGPGGWLRSTIQGKPGRKSPAKLLSSSYPNYATETRREAPLQLFSGNPTGAPADHKGRLDQSYREAESRKEAGGLSGVRFKRTPKAFSRPPGAFKRPPSVEVGKKELPSKLL